ncbi:MAG: dienelactone hydrolase [Kordiimonadaceae bacterium]|nr:dienelactone hydrolase [Kordiimonadaceae bacterium]
MLGIMTTINSNARDNSVDGLWPDAPDLASPGHYKIGVRTLYLSHKNQIDVINIEKGKPLPHYDRPLTVEVWYPADTDKVGGTYKNVYLRDGKTLVDLYGSAVRDAKPISDTKYPLIIISHGYPGNRFLMSHFGEHLASNGYIVVAIDHTDSNYQDAGAFPSTLLNRPYDQKFVLDEIARLSNEKGHFLKNIVDTENTGLIGYSMGGYGAVITAGGGVSKKISETEEASPQGILSKITVGSDNFKKLIDPRFKAIVAIAPWGMERGFWDDAGLANIRKPMFFISGSVDDVSGYENGTKLIFKKAINTDRYLLTFENGNHNTAAPIPAPVEAFTATYNNGKSVAYSHYSDPVWDQLRMNNIADHFVTAYFGKLLKNDAKMDDYLSLKSEANDATGDNRWRGFKPRTAKGLKLEHLSAGQ